MSDKFNSNVNVFWLAALMFVGLKLGNVISWSWWWVFSPVWISLVLGIIVFLVVYMIGLFKGLMDR